MIGLVYGAVLAIGQPDVMALAADTPISRFGFIILGVFARTGDAQAGSVLYMVNHGLAAALFLTAGILVARGSREVADFGGVWARAPRARRSCSRAWPRCRCPASARSSPS